MQTEPNLDPTNWGETRDLAHSMLDDLFDHLHAAHEGPAWQPVPQSTLDFLDDPLPRDGAPLEEVYGAFKTHILPYGTGNLNPRFYGWAVGNGTVTGMLAEMLAAGMNPHMAGFNQSATHVERLVLDWLAGHRGALTYFAAR